MFMLRREDKYFENIEDLSGLSKNHPLLSFSLLLVLFSLAGIPPLAGFFAKFYVFSSNRAVNVFFSSGRFASTVIAAFLLFKVNKNYLFRLSKEKYEKNHTLGLKFSLLVSSIFILLYFVYPSWLLEIVENIIII